MPWDSFKENGKWCVYKLDDQRQPEGDTLGCHDNEGDAKAQLRALYANTGGKSHPWVDAQLKDTEYADPKDNKLRIGTPQEVADAITALGPGFRGHKVQFDEGTRSAAIAAIRRRIGQLNIDDDQKANLRDRLDSLGKKGYVSPKPIGVFSKVKGGVTMYKGQDGLRYMMIVTSNSYEDRDEETIATPALKSYVERAWAVEDKCLPNNEALFWHEGEPIGDVVWTDMEGPFLYEVIKERPNAWIWLSKQVRGTVKGVWDFIESNPKRYRWGASHGFKYLESAKHHNVYNRISKFETSVLPLDAAANPYTFAGVIDPMNRDKVLDDMTKIPGLAGKFRKGIRQVKQELDKLGLEHKAKQGTAVKGMLDDAQKILDDAFAQIGTVPDGFSAGVLQQLVASMAGGMDAAGEPDGDEVGAAYNELGDDPVSDTGNVDETGKSEIPMPMHGKELAQKEAAQVKLLDRLITSQGAMAEAQIGLLEQSEMTQKALADVTSALKTVAPVVKSIDDLSARLAAIEKRMSGAPRRAALAEETVIENKKITENAEKMLGQFEELFPGSGVKVRKD